MFTFLTSQREINSDESSSLSSQARSKPLCHTLEIQIGYSLVQSIDPRMTWEMKQWILLFQFLIGN